MSFKAKIVLIGMSLFLAGCSSANLVIESPIGHVGKQNTFEPIAMAEKAKSREIEENEPIEEQIMPEISSDVEIPLEEKQEPMKESVSQPESEPQQYEIPITNRNASEFNATSGETVATIRMPSVGVYAPVTFGDSQTNINAYDITIRQGAQFDSNSAVILAGHNYKSFANLFSLHIGDVIYFHSYYGDFTFRVDNMIHGFTDSEGTNIYDVNGNEIIDFYSYTNKLYMYTCDYTGAQSRFVVTAHKI